MLRKFYNLNCVSTRLFCSHCTLQSGALVRSRSVLSAPCGSALVLTSCLVPPVRLVHESLAESRSRQSQSRVQQFAQDRGRIRMAGEEQSVSWLASPCQKAYNKRHRHANSTKVLAESNLVCAASIEWQNKRGYSSAYVRLCERMDTSKS